MVDFTSVTKTYVSFIGIKLTILHTQVVWAETTHVGCGQKRCTDGPNSGKTITVCNYFPGGNLKGLAHIMFVFVSLGLFSLGIIIMI